MYSYTQKKTVTAFSMKIVQLIDHNTHIHAHWPKGGAFVLNVGLKVICYFALVTPPDHMNYITQHYTYGIHWPMKKIVYQICDLTMVKCHEFDKNGTELKLPDHNSPTTGLMTKTLKNKQKKKKKLTSRINNRTHTHTALEWLWILSSEWPLFHDIYFNINGTVPSSNKEKHV